MRRPVTIVGLLLVLGSACDDQEPPTTGTTGTTTGTSTTGTDGTSSDGADGESSGPGWPLPTEDEFLTCVRTCEFPADCCPPSTLGECPSGVYPYNFMCIDGLCVDPPCVADSDCMGEGEVCTPVGGLPSCVIPCDGDDAACMAVDPDLTCSGTTDEGAAYCFAHCTTPTVTCGITTCDEASGVCVCENSGVCQVDWECV